MTEDINLYAAGSGGEIAIIAGDVVLTNVLLQQAFLAMFGGNVEASTLGNEPAGVERLDWWGNSVFNADNPAKQFNSLTERALQDNALNSSGRLNIMAAALADLQYLRGVANVAVNVVILGLNRVRIDVTLTQPQNQQDLRLQVIWDGAKKELIVEQVI